MKNLIIRLSLAKRKFSGNSVVYSGDSPPNAGAQKPRRYAAAIP
jgi:hypothetical protein